MASGFALMSSVGNLLGGFAGQYVIGYLRQQTDTYAAVFAVLSASTLLTAVIVRAIGRSIAPRANVVALAVE